MRNSLWVSLIKLLHGIGGGLSGGNTSKTSTRVWEKIVGSISKLRDVRIVDRATMFRVLGDGSSTRFWFDTWCGGLTFKDQFDRLFALAVGQEIKVSDCWVRDFLEIDG